MDLRNQRESTNYSDGKGFTRSQQILNTVIQAMGGNIYARKGWNPDEHKPWQPKAPNAWPTEEELRAAQNEKDNAARIHNEAQQTEAAAAANRHPTQGPMVFYPKDKITPGSLLETLKNMF